MKYLLIIILIQNIILKNKKTIGILTLSVKKLSKIIERKYDEDDLDLKNMLLDNYLNKKASFISETYINWLKNVKLKIIPININSSNKKIKEILQNVDGLLLTGGGINLFKFKNGKKKKSKYLKKVEFIINKVKEINDKERTFPIWATCLGFEALLINESKNTLKRHKVDDDVKNVYPIHIKSFNTESMQFFTEDEIETMENKRIFYFNHKFGFFTKEILHNKFLNGVKIVADTKLKGNSVVVWIEFKNYPFFGSQFHPEKITNKKYIKDYSPFSQFYINQKLALLFKKHLTGFRGDIRGKDLKIHSINLYNIGMYKKIRLIDSLD